MKPKYEWLRVRNLFNDEYILDDEGGYLSYANDIPKGWYRIFGEQMIDDLNELLIKYDFVDEYRIMQIKEKYGCYDKETEVLTKGGWKYFKDVGYSDEFATLDSDGETLIYQMATDIISYQYKGDIYRLENRGISLCVTPNHNLYVSKGSYYYHKKDNKKITFPYEFTTPEKYFNKDKRFKKGATWSGRIPNDKFIIKGREYTNYMKRNNCYRTYKSEDLEYDIIPFIRFLGFYIAEGHSDVNNGTQITLSYNYTTDEKELAYSLISGLGEIPKDGSRGIARFHNHTLAHWLKEHCGHLAQNKKVPNFIKKLPPQHIEEFLKYLYIGDGHKAKTSNILITVSKQLSNDVQELLLKCGYAFRETLRMPKKAKKLTNGRLIQGKRRMYGINWLKLTEVEIDNSKAKNTKSFVEEYIDYNDMVYCATVPNHILYIRRNGKGLWCGNSLRWYDNGVPEEASLEYCQWLNKYERLSEETCIKCGDKTTHMQKGWIVPLCDRCGNK